MNIIIIYNIIGVYVAPVVGGAIILLCVLLCSCCCILYYKKKKREKSELIICSNNISLKLLIGTYAVNLSTDNRLSVSYYIIH